MTATRTVPFCRRVSLAAFLCCLVAGPGHAGESVQWRTDYNAARREATEKGLPLFLDFGTEECYHCRRLDQTTFRDPAIVKLLNERFVPLRVDANREPALAQALRIQAYPTLVLAGHDGKILGTVEGYLESPRLSDHLQRALAMTTPDWMARDYQEATKAINAGDYTRAVSLLKGVLEDGKDRPVQSKARQVLSEVEQQAVGRLTRAKQLEDKGQTLEAVETLTELLGKYAGTDAAKEGAKLLSSLADQPEIRQHQRYARSRELLAQAREEFRAERWLRCLDHCDILASTYKDTPAGIEAAQLASDIKGSPERMAKVCESMTERTAQMYVALAESWVKKGNVQEASVCLERVVKLCPNSPHAEGAEARLAQLKSKTPATPVQFSKPKP
jgi:thioredoxin-like negative regulator of GroEL